jgi:hypothetical protein
MMKKVLKYIHIIKSGREIRLYDSTATLKKQGANTDKATL